MFLINKKYATKKSLAVTSEGMHFKGQFLPKESYIILGKKIEFLGEAFNYVSHIKYNNVEYFISNELWEEKN